MTFSVHLKNSGSLSLECFMNGLIYNIHDSLWEFPHTNSQKQFTEKMKRFSKKKKYNAINQNLYLGNLIEPLFEDQGRMIILLHTNTKTVNYLHPKANG